MASTLTLALSLAMLCTGGDAVENRYDTKSFASFTASNVFHYSHHLSCGHNQTILIVSLQVGYKATKCRCEDNTRCCPSVNNDCRQDISPDILHNVTLDCLDKSECRPLVTKPKDSCWKDGVEFQWPTYSMAGYFCVPGDTVVDMTKQTSVSGGVVTVRALPAGLPHSHTVTCSVQTVGGGKVSMIAALSQGAPPLSRLSLGTQAIDHQGRTMTLIEVATPFQLRLQQPAHSSLHYAWVSMEAPPGGKLHLTCGQEETTLPPTTAGNENLETPGTDAVTTDLMTSQSVDGGTSTSVPVSSSSGGREQLESDTMLPKTAHIVAVAVTVAAVIGGLVGALAASSVFLWRRRQRARGTGHGTQPDQGGRIVLAELATAQPDVTYEPLRTEGGYQRLALPGRIGVPPGDVTSAGENNYDNCDLGSAFDVTEKDPTDVSRVNRQGQGVDEAPYDVIEPSYVNEHMN